MLSKTVCKNCINKRRVYKGIQQDYHWPWNRYDDKNFEEGTVLCGGVCGAKMVRLEIEGNCPYELEQLMEETPK